MRNPLLQSRARSLRHRTTDAERHLWFHLRRRQLGRFRFRRQVVIGGFIADFACIEAGLVIEVDGGQHQEQRKYDEERSRQIAALGFRVLRFWDSQALLQTEEVLEAILRVLGEPCPHPSLPPQAGEGA